MDKRGEMGIIKIDGYICERCSHKWISRANSEHIPIVCPKCKSPYWQIPRKKSKTKSNFGKGERK